MLYLTFLVVLICIGMWLGTLWIKRAGSNATAAGQRHDAISVSDSPDVRAKIDAWAGTHGYERIEPATDIIRYQKNVNARNGNPTYLDARISDGSLSLESYMGVINPFTRQPSGQVPLSLPGLVLSIPRKLARRDHDALRRSLGLPGIG